MNRVFLSRRSAIAGSLAATGAAILPSPAQAFIPLLLSRFLVGTVARGTAGRASLGTASRGNVSRLAGERVRFRTDIHLRGVYQLARQLNGRSDIVFSEEVEGQYGSAFPDGAEVVLTNLPDRQLTSFVSVVDDIPIPVVHPLQLHMMDKVASIFNSRFGSENLVSVIYPIRLLHLDRDFGFSRIVYETLKGKVEMEISKSAPIEFTGHINAQVNGSGVQRGTSVVRYRPHYF
jgi:hypothetical protein